MTSLADLGGAPDLSQQASMAYAELQQDKKRDLDATQVVPTYNEVLRLSGAALPAEVQRQQQQMAAAGGGDVVAPATTTHNLGGGYYQGGAGPAGNNAAAGGNNQYAAAYHQYHQPAPGYDDGGGGYYDDSPTPRRSMASQQRRRRRPPAADSRRRQRRQPPAVRMRAAPPPSSSSAPASRASTTGPGLRYALLAALVFAVLHYLLPRIQPLMLTPPGGRGMSGGPNLAGKCVAGLLVAAAVYAGDALVVSDLLTLG